MSKWALHATSIHGPKEEGICPILPGIVAQAISLPTVLLKVGVSNGAISLQYIHSRTDLSVLIIFSGKRLFSVSF